MSNDELLSDLRDIVHVAGKVWLGREAERADREVAEQRRTLAREARRDRLARVSSRMQRVDEVDARIVAVEIADNLPNRDRWIGQLRRLRERLLKEAKE